MALHSDKSNSFDRRFKRDTVRLLSLFYDALIFTAIFLVLFLTYREQFYKSWMTNSVILLQAVISAVPIFCARFVFRVYKQVLRYGNPGVIAYLLLSDLLGSGIYVAINALLPPPYHVSLLLALTLVLTNFVVCTIARLAYYKIYCLAQKENAIGRILHWLLRRFALADARSDAVAQVLSLDEWLGRTSDTTADPINDIQHIAREFQINGEVVDILRINSGYINRTYRVRTQSKDGKFHSYTLQRINTNVFPDVDALMANYTFVINHLHDRFLLSGHTNKGSVQTLKLTRRDAKPYYRDDSGCWRMLSHFTDVYGMDIPDSPETFYYAGQSFGLFIKCMSDVPIEDINIVIPNFHNTYSRYLDLEKTIEADAVHRLQDVWNEVNFIRNRKDKFGLIADALERGIIPTRVCHNDCNLNNILFSNKTHLPVAIIDLDTVMPSSPLYDYGDSMRIGTNTARDNETDLSKVSCDLNLYKHYARGYLEACGDILTQEELELLPLSSLIITAEDGIRFLTDHLNGDTYYHIFYPGQNLDRTRTQLKLLYDMEIKLPQIRDILHQLYQEFGFVADPYKIDF